jgi:hypothetical protein
MYAGHILFIIQYQDVKVPHRTLRWLLPPECERWVGLNDSVEVAHVWPDGIVGNQVEQWNWHVLPTKTCGHVDGTGDDDRDLYEAMDRASKEFFKAI